MLERNGEKMKEPCPPLAQRFPVLKLLLILSLLLSYSAVYAEPSETELHTSVDPSLGESLTCRARIGNTVATGVGFEIKLVSAGSKSRESEFAIVDRTGCSLTFFGKEVSVGKEPDVVLSAAPNEAWPKLRPIAYNFASDLVPAALDAAKERCKERSAVEIQPPYNQTEYVICVEHRIRRAMKRVGIAYVFSDDDRYEQIQVWVDHGKILGVAGYERSPGEGDGVSEFRIGERK